MATPKLYHYVHCPFCIRVRMAFGFLSLNYESHVLPYDDEKTPVDLTGVKMLPILEVEGKAMNESLDIIKFMDPEDKTLIHQEGSSPKFKDFLDLLDKMGKHIHSLAMPYLIYSKEFNESSRQYFMKKKGKKRGPFNELAQKKDELIGELTPYLEDLEIYFSPYFGMDRLTIYDICLASHLWALYMVPEFQFSPEIHEYLQKVKAECRFDYHYDFWH